MKNYVSEGNQIKHKLAVAVESGEVVIATDLHGFAMSKGIIGDEVAFLVQGLVRVASASATTFAVGDKIGYTVAGKLAQVAQGDKFIGVCTIAKIAGELDVEMLIVQGLV